MVPTEVYKACLVTEAVIEGDFLDGSILCSLPGGCMRGMDVETWTLSKHKGELGTCDWWGGMLVSVDLERCALLSASLAVRALMAACASSSSSSPTPKTQVSGEVPHAWLDVRRGRIRRAETFPRLSLLVRCMSLLNCKGSYAVTWHAQKEPPRTVVSRMSTVVLLMAPLAVSQIPKGMGRAIGKRTIL